MEKEPFYCTSCGKELAPGSEYCPACGAQTASQDATQQDATYQNAMQTNATYRKEQEKKALIAAILLAIGAIVTLWFGIDAMSTSASEIDDLVRELDKIGLSVNADDIENIMNAIGYFWIAGGVICLIPAVLCFMKKYYTIAIIFSVLGIVVGLLSTVIGVVFAIIAVLYVKDAKPAFQD
jgi:predicted RNA-binding Zn-ribbon protein involved in translation (DUF1610 family)